MNAKGPWTLLIAAGLTVLPHGPVARGQEQATGSAKQRVAKLQAEAERQSWWFPTNMPTGTKYHYRAVLKAENTFQGKTTQVHEQTDFAVAVSPAATGQSGCIVRMLPPDPSPATSGWLTRLWIERLAEDNPDGVWATTDGIFVHDVPLLRGPWRTGDRFSVFGFGAWLLPLLGSGYVVGTLHFDVYSATPTDADLKFDFWAGRAAPVLRGTGELSFESDAEGIALITANWTRTLGSEKREAVLTITRLRIDTLQEGTATPPERTAPPSTRAPSRGRVQVPQNSYQNMWHRFPTGVLDAGS